MSELDHLDCPVTQKKGGKRQTTQTSASEPAASSNSAHHPFSRARACLMQAKLINSCGKTSSITLAGCSDSLAQRRRSHASASTSQGTETQKAGVKGSRASRPSRAARGTSRAVRSTRGKANPTVVGDAKCQSQQDCGEDVAVERAVLLKQAELLLQGYHASHGHPLLQR